MRKYLDTSGLINLVAILDLQNTLGQVQNYLFEEADHNTNNSHVVESDLQVGEHIALFWIENNTMACYPGLVEKVNDDGVFVARFISSRIKTNWIFPDEADTQIIQEDQILKRHNCNLSSI